MAMSMEQEGGAIAAFLVLIGVIVSSRTQLKQAILQARVKESTEMRQLVKEMLSLSQSKMASDIILAHEKIENARLTDQLLMCKLDGEKQVADIAYLKHRIKELEGDKRLV